jgi:hypothetical protein
MLTSAALSLVGFFLRMHLLQLVIHVSTSLVIPYHTKRSLTSESVLSRQRNPLNTWFINNFEKFKLIDGILYRVINTNGELVQHWRLSGVCLAKVIHQLKWQITTNTVHRAEHVVCCRWPLRILCWYWKCYSFKMVQVIWRGHAR